MERRKLFWVISRVSKEPGIKSAGDFVATFDYNPVLICVQKLLIEKYIPLSVEYFTATMGHQSIASTFPTHVLSGEVLKCIWEL